MSNKIEVLTNGTGELIIREGKAEEIHEPKDLSISGILSNPLRYLEKRLAAFPETECHIVVDREKISITLVANERDHVKTNIVGQMEFHPSFLKFGINSGEYKTAYDLAELIKMNRSFFENQTVAMTLVNTLKNFKAKVNKEVEKSTNDRGDTRMLLDQVVQSNLPENFFLVVPIFKGEKKEKVEVEIYINPHDLTCTLISPQVNESIEYLRDSAIDRNLDTIKEIAPSIVVFEK